MTDLTAANIVGNNNPLIAQKNSQAADLRQVAAQFESILLMQLTSALNGSNDDGEDNLFGADAGTGMAKQMFAEQMATVMAQSGGVGLADLIVDRLGAKRNVADKTGKFSKAHEAVKNISNSEIAEHSATPVVSRKEKIALINKAARYTPIENEANVSAESDFAVVSTAAEEIIKYGDADLPKPIMGDEKLFKFVRPRVVPDHALSVEAPSVVVNNSADAATPSLENVNSVNYQMPLASFKLTSKFGNRFHPIEHKTKFHAGVDLAAPKGTPIAAAADGKVVFSGWRQGYGNTIVIEHRDGKQTRYGHADKLFASLGEQITAGQQIATVGSTGKSTGPHLHFEILENGRHLNPLEIISKDFQN